MITFEFFRFRFHFRALDSLHFPAGESSNVVRGAFGNLLRRTAPETYSRLFEPRASLGRSPSGLSDWPRPFLFRTAPLDGRTFLPGASFHIDVHVFELREPVIGCFQDVFQRFAVDGLGPGRGRAELLSAEQLDLDDHGETTAIPPGQPSSVSLEAGAEPVCAVEIRFVSPTELKAEGRLAERPEFLILYGRLRDRLSNLRALYGAGPLEIDFRATNLRAASIRLGRCELVRQKAERRSGRTGQTHSLGGFTGFAEYEGELSGFLPWLRAARWIGVGRQTVWGKGDVRVVQARKC